jgi:hypothetical protein
MAYQSIGTCRRCGKQIYRDRKTAKQVAKRLFPAESMRAYVCPAGFVHFGHLAATAKTG